MTVSYQYDVASSTSGGFTRLLFKWKGSVYKLVWRELLWFTFAYTLLSVLYRAVLTPEQKSVFERIVDYFNTFLGLIPLSFVLGVYVTLVVTRWWQQFLAIPWPDKLAHCIALYVTGTDEHTRMIRRTMARYLNLSLILVLRSISMAVKKRFPTLQHLVEGGFMTKTELELYQSVPSSEFNTYWIPCTWLISLIKDARTGNRIVDSQGLKLLVEEFNEFRSKCGLLWSYDWVSIPLVYTQVVTLATYSFFAACVIGRQYVRPIGSEAQMKEVDLYIPIFTFLQFFFYMGLLKVAEALINPFGDDDEDFELNWMIDRHLKVSYLVVDTLMNRTPPLVKDAHYDDPEPTLAYTKAAMMYKKKTFRGSVAAVLVPEDEQTMVLPEIAEEEEENSDYNSDLSINRHSSSIINLLTWTSSAGNRLLHHSVSNPTKKPSCDSSASMASSLDAMQLRTRRSLSVTDDVMISAECLPPHHMMPRSTPASPTRSALDVTSCSPDSGAPFSHPSRHTAAPSSGIRRGFSLSTNAGSSLESVACGVPEAGASSVVKLGDEEEEEHSFQQQLLKEKGGEVGDGGGGGAGMETETESVSSAPEQRYFVGSDIASSSNRKSRSLDLGKLVRHTVVDETSAAPKAKPARSGILPSRLRDLKRRHKKRKRKEPPEEELRTEIEERNVGGGRELGTKVGEVAPVSAGGVTSVSLPSLHIPEIRSGTLPSRSSNLPEVLRVSHEELQADVGGTGEGDGGGGGGGVDNNGLTLQQKGVIEGVRQLEHLV